MLNLYLLAGLLAQEPLSVPEAPSPPVTGEAPVHVAPPPVLVVWPPNDPASLAVFLDNERRYAERLAGAMGHDLRREWLRYADDEEDKARDRAEGDDDDDIDPQGFGDYLDARYRKRRNIGIMLFGIGFAPLGFGLYTGLTLGEAEPMLGVAAVGGTVIISGAVVWAVRGVQLRHLREVRASLDARPYGRVQWRGLAPTYDPRSRSHGLSVGFAF
jgi:hypothetical protein